VPITSRSVLRVLLAEDSVLVRGQLAHLLGEVPGVQVAGEASSGAETLEAVSRLDPDVLVLDLRMPGGDGFHVLERIGGRKTPAILVLTNSADPRTRARCRELGARDVFDKSTEFEAMIRSIRGLAPSKEAS
jgi:DNA-binding NarL/FixJ family response regulator